MKLLELLVKERIVWPDGVARLAQDPTNALQHLSERKCHYALDGWRGDARNDHRCCYSYDLNELSEDYMTAIITREQYEQACKLVDDGYTLWFGGECLVDNNTYVDIAYDDNQWIETKMRANLYDWKNESKPYIIAYKVIKVMSKFKPTLISTHKNDASLEAFRACGRTDEQLIEHGYAKIIGPNPDNVNHPSHYTNGKVECIDAIEAATVGKTGIEAVCVANVIKYLWRYEDKNGMEDIKKAQWYLNKLIEVCSDE